MFEGFEELFQFLNGTIKRKSAPNYNASLTKFKFLDGAIKRCSLGSKTQTM
jgi:hypothetical protein